MKLVKKDLRRWFLKDCGPKYKDDDCITIEGETGKLKLYTDTNEYSITARPSVDQGPDQESGYLGCVVSSRKPRAGETWTRGNDLPDGVYSDETATSILKGILNYELVKIHKPVKFERIHEEELNGKNNT